MDNAPDVPDGVLSDEEEEEKGAEVKLPQISGFEAELEKVPEAEREIIRKGRAKAQELEVQQHSEQWIFVKEKNATKIWAYKSEDGFICVKSERAVHYSIDELLEALENFEIRKKINDKTGEMRLVK